jgi:hypothetical protein
VYTNHNGCTLQVHDVEPIRTVSVVGVSFKGKACPRVKVCTCWFLACK